MIDEIPLEILVEILKYLDFKSFKELKKLKKSIRLKLPQIPKLYLSAFKNSFKQLKRVEEHCRRKNCTLLNNDDGSRGTLNNDDGSRGNDDGSRGNDDGSRGNDDGSRGNDDGSRGNDDGSRGNGSLNNTGDASGDGSDSSGSNSGTSRSTNVNENNNNSTFNSYNEESKKDWSAFIGLDSSEASNLNTFQFLVRYGFTNELERMLNLNAKLENHLSLQDLEILMGIATGGTYDPTVTYINLNEDFGYHKEIAWLLINYRPHDFVKRASHLVETGVTEDWSIVLADQAPNERNRPINLPTGNPENTTSTSVSAASSNSCVSQKADKKTFANHWRTMQIITIASFQNDLRMFSYFAPKLFNHSKKHYLPLLHCSLAKGCEEISLYILNHWPNIDPSLDENSALILACKTGMVFTVARLLEFPRVVPDISCALAAVTFNHLAILSLLLNDNRLDPSIHSNVLLGCAIHCNRPEMFQVLLNDTRVDPSANNNDLLQVAVTQGTPSFVQMLLAHEKVKPTGSLQLAAIRLLLLE